MAVESPVVPFPGVRQYTYLLSRGDAPSRQCRDSILPRADIFLPQRGKACRRPGLFFEPSMPTSPGTKLCGDNAGTLNTHGQLHYVGGFWRVGSTWGQVLYNPGKKNRLFRRTHQGLQLCPPITDNERLLSAMRMGFAAHRGGSPQGRERILRCAARYVYIRDRIRRNRLRTPPTRLSRDPRFP